MRGEIELNRPTAHSMSEGAKVARIIQWCMLREAHLDLILMTEFLVSMQDECMMRMFPWCMMMTCVTHLALGHRQQRLDEGDLCFFA